MNPKGVGEGWSGHSRASRGASATPPRRVRDDTTCAFPNPSMAFWDVVMCRRGLGQPRECAADVFGCEERRGKPVDVPAGTSGHMRSEHVAPPSGPAAILDGSSGCYKTP